MKSLRGTLRVSCVGLAIGALAFGGCSEGGASSHDHDHEDHSGHDHGDHDHDAHSNDNEVRSDVYDGVLGELVFIPDGSVANQHPKIHHVHIPDFKRQDGTVAMTPDGIPGMRSMTMEFPLAEGVSLDGYSVGDKIRFAFRVNWGGKVAWEMTEVEKIDAETEIDYSNAKAESP